MTRFISIITMSALLIWGCGHSAVEQSSNQQIAALMEAGEFTRATAAIKEKIAKEQLSPEEVYHLNFLIDKMERIKIDYSKADTAALSYIKKYIPDVTPEQIAAWEASGALEGMMIDGVKRYFRSAPRNLFRISKEAQSYWSKINGRQSDGLDQFLAEYLPKCVAEAKAQKSNSFNHFVKPQKMRYTYTLTVPAGEVPEGEMIRVWMPYPREIAKYKELKLISTSQPEYIISPDSYLHKSIYMEKAAKADEPAIFSYQLSFTSYNQWFSFKAEDVKPYNTESDLYKEFTAERKTHVIFTPELKALADSVVGDEQNPYLKAKRIWTYIAQTYPWASAREYSTLDNIPSYVIKNRHGDCGQVSLLFITMCRYKGIPAKWQSGWMLHPGDVNLHDWAEAYFEGIGWVPVDQSVGFVANTEDEDERFFFTKGLDAYRLIVNEDFSADFYPAKIYPRSETVDFQRGEVEWRGGNLYFNRWDYNMDVEYLN